jgi:protein arginine N-methyltransferase 1
MEHPQAYDTQDHDVMQEDTARMRAFAVAIERAVPGRVVLDMGAGPDAVLALCAARCGAARVYAVEGNASAAAAAARLVRRKEETGELRRGVVRVVARVSTDLNFADVPAGTVEVLVHELMGILASSEGVRHFVRGLRPFLAPGCVSIPASACTLVAPGMLPPLELLSAPSIR